MNIRIRSDRRDFLEQPPPASPSRSRSRPIRVALIGEADAADAPFAPNVWLTIATDGTITIVSPAAEMGQGSFTTLPVIIAEELDADWAKVKPVLPPAWDDKKYGNPDYGGSFQTSASASVHGYFKPLRIAGAQARRVLLDAAAAKWNVPVGELSTEPSVVVHKASGRRMSYGEIAALRQGRRRSCRRSRTRTSSRRRASASSARTSPRVELPLKVTGAAQIRAWTCRCRAWSTRRCCNRPIRAARRRRSTTPRRARCRASPTW